MIVRAIIVVIILFITNNAIAQRPYKDSVLIDTTITDYDLLFSELDAFLDSITAPRNYFLFNNGLTMGMFVQPNSENTVQTLKTMVYTPSLSLYHRSGFGISAEASVMHETGKLHPYQYALAGSYDYIKNRRFSSGVSYTHFISNDNLSFYTSPLQSQLFAYFTLKKLWVKPSVAVSYSWGSRSKFQDVEEKIIAIQLAQRGFTRINTREVISDFNVLTSLRHDFYKLKVFSQNDFFRVTPQISFSAGTHQFGINQTSNTYATVRGTGTRILYNSENYSLDNNLFFQPLSLTGFLKTEYSFKKVFINPQFIVDYYFPAPQDNFSTGWVVNVGVLF